MRFFRTQQSQRGDTIVEVLFALAVLGAVIGSAYVITNRNVLSQRSSQERHEALKIVESQFERIKVKALSDPSMFTATTAFCMDQSNQKLAATSASCKVDAKGNPTTEVPQYKISVLKVASRQVGADAQAGGLFKVSVSWENVRGTGDDTIDQFYEVYK